MPGSPAPKRRGEQTLRLVPYSPEWPDEFAAEARRIADALEPLRVPIEHVGSSAVPGLIAKPVIDIAISVAPGEVDELIRPLRSLGYEYRGLHGDDPARRYYVLDQDGTRQFQVHVWISPAQGWLELLAFRDLLRQRPEVARAYTEEKLRVAAAVNWNKAAYSEAKGPFIQRVLHEHGIRA